MNLSKAGSGMKDIKTSKISFPDLRIDPFRWHGIGQK
jgi:hypothetical protein